MNNPATTRCQAVDLVRLYALLAMLFTHAAGKLGQSFRLTTGWDTKQQAAVEGISVIIGAILHVASPLFALLTGVSLAFYVVSRQRRQASPQSIDAYLWKRGALLLALGVGVDSFQLDPPRWTFDPGILGMFGLSLWLLVPLRRLSVSGLYCLTAVLAATVQSYLYFRGNAVGVSWLEGVLLTTGGGTGKIFPVLPWLPVILLGFASGRLVAEGRVDLARLGWRVGWTLVALWGLLYLAGYPMLFRKHPPTLDYQLPYLAAGFFLLALHARFRQPENWWTYRTLVVVARCSLFFYLIHAKLVLNGLARLVAPLGLPMPWSAAVLALLGLLVLVPLCRAITGSPGKESVPPKTETAPLALPA